MTKKTITIITALTAVVVLIAAYFGLQAYRRANPPPSPWDSFNFETPPVLARFDLNKLNRIENITQGFALVNNGEEWVLVSDNFNPDHINISQTSIYNMLWLFANIWSDSLIDENPEDISIFGFDNPLAHILVGDSDGNTEEFILGIMNPARTAYYVMLKGQPEVYTMSVYTAETINFNIDSIRDRELLRNFEPEYFIDYLVEYRPGDTFYEKGKIEITRRLNENPYISSYTQFDMLSPYNRTYGADGNRLWEVLESLLYTEIVDFIEDAPASLVPYGLDRPGRILVNSAQGSYELLYGRKEGYLHYAKFPDSNSVFTVSGLDSIIDASPFSLMDKFILIHMIDDIDRFTVTTEGRSLTGTIQGTGDDVIFHLNGRRASVREFRGFYQTVIGLLKDAELTDSIARTIPPETASREEILIEYWHNNPQGLHTSVRLIPYNRDFYLVEKQGVSEFLLARTQVRRIFDSADAMVYLE